jgi:aspartate aminotransferase-like enzyme
MYSAAGYESPTVTCVNNDRGIDINALNQFLRQKGMIISNGYGSLKGKNFRIAHMGDTNMEDMEILFAAMDEFFAA